MEPVVVILIGVLIVAGIVGGYFAHLAAKKRREELAALADSLGWSYDPNKTSIDRSALDRFPQFQEGRTRRLYNTIWGTLELDGGHASAAQLGDYTYRVTRGTGKNRRTTTYRLSYAAFRLPHPNVPDMRIRLEGFMDRIAGAFGFDDIDFESEEFSRKYHVTCGDKKFAYDLIHPRMMDLMLAERQPQIDIVEGYMCLSHGTRTWQPQEFEREIGFARAFFELWPEHLVDRLQRT